MVKESQWIATNARKKDTWQETVLMEKEDKVDKEDREDKVEGKEDPWNATSANKMDIWQRTAQTNQLKEMTEEEMTEEETTEETTEAMTEATTEEGMTEEMTEVEMTEEMTEVAMTEETTEETIDLQETLTASLLKSKNQQKMLTTEQVDDLPHWTNDLNQVLFQVILFKWINFKFDFFQWYLLS